MGFKTAVVVCALILTCNARSFAADAQPFELPSYGRLTYDGQVIGNSKATESNIEFGVLAVRPLDVETNYNPVSGAVEQTIIPPNNHPTAVLRANSQIPLKIPLTWQP